MSPFHVQKERRNQIKGSTLINYMKKILLLIVILLITQKDYSQKTNKVTHLKDFFFGIPVEQDVNAWIQFISTQPYLGIDSSSSKGISSSIKENIASHFPFPDSIKATIFLTAEGNYGPTNDTTDTSRKLFIEGDFGNTPSSKKQMDKLFLKIKSMLTNYYTQTFEFRYYDIIFVTGINENFPTCSLVKGYSERKKTYYVLLFVKNQSWMQNK